MPHPFRLEPPVALRGTLHRDRLLDRLRARWSVRVLVVSAPAGFGKTTLLAEALAENAAGPVGIDCWLACEPDDATVSSLAIGLCEAVDAGPAPLDSVELAAAVVTSAMWRRSPQQVSLIVDDVQHVPPGSSAASLLASVITSLPANGHVVLACRGEPPVPLARVEVAGGVLRLDQDALSFTPEELDQFADLRGVPSREVVTSDGWPALAELAASARSDATVDYVSQEVLAGLTASERRDLALLAHLGPFDEELARAALGRTIDARALTANLPLVTEVPSGERTLHGLWQSLLAEEARPDEIAEARRRAAEVLVGRDRLPAAMRLLMDAEAWDAVADVAVRALGAAHPPVPRDVLEDWLARLPAEVRDRPGGRLLSAIVSVEADPQGAWQRFDDVAGRFRAEGHAAGELACIVQLGQLAWWSESFDQLAALVGRVFELEAGGCPEAIPLACLGRALVIDLMNDSRGVLAALDRVPPASLNDVWQGVVTWLRSTSLMHLGHAAPALAAAEGALLHAGPLHEPLAEGARLQALCFLGHVETVAEELPRLVARMDVAGYRNYTAITAAQCCALLALQGRREQAADYLAIATEAAADPPAPLVETDLAIARAAMAVEAGDEPMAAEILSEHVGRHPLGVGHSAAPQQRTLSLFYVLVPESRAHWDAADLGPAFVLARDLARAVVALRAGHDLPEALTRLPAPGIVRAHLPLRWIAELAVAATASGRDGGSALLDDVAGAARPRVVELAKAPKGHLRKAARAVLTVLSAPPDGHFELRLLGPVELRRDGMSVGAPEWRRPRVRKLLGYLTLHQVVSRERLAEELWPDLAWEAQSRNLRVTLTYLLRVLEPQRAPRDPSYFIRTQGSTLSLHAGDHLSVDVWEFDALGDEAVRADGERRPSEVLDVSLRAVELWRGEPSELLSEPWAVLQLEQRRLRFASVATRAGELLLAQRNSVAAHALASRALAIDPWLEGAHRLIVAAHRSTGDERAARHALVRYRELIEELGIAPDEATQMVERLVDLVPV